MNLNGDCSFNGIFEVHSNQLRIELGLKSNLSHLHTK